VKKHLDRDPLPPSLSFSGIPAPVVQASAYCSPATAHMPSPDKKMLVFFIFSGLLKIKRNKLVESMLLFNTNEFHAHEPGFPFLFQLFEVFVA
jgi:hypothetical protein